MLKDRKKYWAVLLASLFLASCNQTQETAEDESSTQATAREFDTYESKKHPESPRGLIFFVKFIGYILRDLA